MKKVLYGVVFAVVLYYDVLFVLSLVSRFGV